MTRPVHARAEAARGVKGADLQGKPAELAMPTTLVQRTFAADRVLTY
jgi:hypothetical protein